MRTLLSVASATFTLLAFSAFASAQGADEGGHFDFEAYLEEAHSWGDVTVTAGPDFLELDWDGLEMGPSAARDARYFADGILDGEEDGQVDEDEADQFLFGLGAVLEHSVPKVLNRHELSGIVLIDQAEASDADVTRTEADGLVGPVDSDEGIVAGFTIVIEFPNIDDDKDIHTVRVDLGDYFIPSGHEDDADDFAGDFSLTFQGADGWSIDEDSIQPGCAADNYEDGAIVFTGDDIDCFTGHDGILLAFAITGQGDESHALPGFEAALLAGVLGGAWVLARRRSH